MLDAIPIALMAALESGGYISLLKLAPAIIVLLVWARLLTWMDKDALAAHLPREALNTALFGAGLLGVVLFLVLPTYPIALGGLLLMMLVSIGAYLAIRHQKVGLGDLKGELSGFFSGIGRKKEGVAKAGEVQIITKGGRVMEPPAAEDPTRPGYDAAMAILTDPLRLNSERIEVRPSEGTGAIQFYVDGVGYPAPAIDMTNAAAGITYVKRAAGLDVEDRRKPQVGAIKAILDGKKFEMEVATAGSTAGESMRLTVNPKKRHDFKLDTLGLASDQLEAIKAVIADNRGIVLVTAPKGQGLTSLLYVILRAHDAFLNHIQTIERAPKEDLEGITVNKLPSNASAAEEQKQVEWVTSQQPDTMMLDDIISPASAKTIIQSVAEGRRAYIGMRANSAFDAITAWRKLVGDDALATKELAMIINGRVLRRLCMACKVAYSPDPEMLRKLNMDPARVEKLFQARTEPLRDNRGRPIPCDFCHDLHYKGRFGVFEMIVVDDDIRNAIMTGGSVNQLKTIFRKQRGLYLQEMALAQVEAGETSVQEVLRVLKSEPSSSAKQVSAAAGPRRG